MKSRCNSPKHKCYKNYGGRGIKIDMSFWDLGLLYERDNAGLMKDPTIDRIENDGNYTFENCQFLERVDNVRKELIGHRCSDETKHKIAEGNRGKTISVETRRKLSDFNKGKVLSAEHREKMSLSAKKRWERVRGNT